MIKRQYSFEAFEFSSKIIRDLVREKQTVSPFLETFFSLDNLSEQARKRAFGVNERLTLTKVLIKQNERVQISSLTAENIEALQNEKTVTITTGHQLNLLTGPLYSIYKVAQVIALSRAMNKRDQEYRYVPVFWMATEDHDFEEINHIHLFGSKIEWEKEGQNDRIVGEINPQGMENFLVSIAEKYRDEALKKELDSFLKIYRESRNLAEATRVLMNQLFGEHGLVIIDGNDKTLKESFSSVAAKEINEGFVYDAVTQTNEELERAGYHQQVYLRHNNLFYIDEKGTRKRISNEEGVLAVDNVPINKEALLEELEQHPEHFSPNALLRPVYQELILPNIAYVGGGGEIAYWLQLKGVFEALKLDFPLLRVRDSLVLMRDKELEDLEDLDLSIKALEEDVNILIKAIALEDVEVEIELDHERKALEQIKNELLVKAREISNGMDGMIEAEFSKMEKSIDRIEAKLIKAEKSKHDQKAKKIKRLQQKVYPNGGFQERYENFIPYYLNDKDFVSKIVDILEPTDHPNISIVQI